MEMMNQNQNQNILTKGKVEIGNRIIASNWTPPLDGNASRHPWKGQRRGRVPVWVISFSETLNMADVSGTGDSFGG